MKTVMLQAVKPILSLAPTSHSGTTAQAGALIDRLGYDTVIVAVNNAAASGSPTAATLTLTVSHGAASGGGDLASVTLDATPAVIDATSAGLTYYEFNLRPLKRYVKFTTTPAFTDGTTPAIVAAVTAFLGDPKDQPAPSDVTIYSKA